jgi:hypothetical protein
VIGSIVLFLDLSGKLIYSAHHTNHHHHHVPIAPAPQAPKWQIVQQPGGNFVMQQVGGGNVLGFSLPSAILFLWTNIL